MLRKVIYSKKIEVKKEKLVEKYRFELNAIFKDVRIDVFGNEERLFLDQKNYQLFCEIYSKCRNDGRNKDYSYNQAYKAVEENNIENYEAVSILKEIESTMIDVVEILDN